MGSKVTRAITLRPWEIRGLLAGEITQLRRLVKPQPPSEPEIVMRDIPGTPLWYAAVEAGRSDVGIEYRPVAQYDDYRLVCPYPPGTELWGREGYWLVERDGMGIGERHLVFADEWNSDGHVIAGAPYRRIETERFGAYSPITMPRWASRWSGIVEAVRVERVEDITEADAVRCGNWNRIGFVAQFEKDYSRVGANPWCWGYDLKGATNGTK